MKEDATHRLLLLIEEQLGWGSAANWPSKDFEKLNILIQEKTRVSLSASTLRRVWGKVDYNNQPSTTTLDTLAQFASYENWRTFCASPEGPIKPKLITLKHQNKLIFRPVYIVGLFVFMLIIIAASIVLVKPGSTTVHAKNYSFSYRPITHDLPNSVIFTYDAHAAPNDSVFIQQSWDNARRTRVAKNARQFSSIYYKPGFYHAKLVIGNQIVKESPLLIPTNGWLALIEQQPVPVYLDQHEFVEKAGMSVDIKTLLNHNIPLEPQPPVTEFYNSGNFKPVSILNFAYRVEIKNSYKTGASRCQSLNVILITDHIPISIPLSEPGCIASLILLNGVKEIDGSSTDLSGVGVDLSNWVNLSCVSNDNQVTIMVNNKIAYKFNIPDKQINILGIGFEFHGTGNVRHIALSSNNKMVFQDF